MEIFELRYFLAVAQVENVNRAAETIHVSPGSLSKAISRLESELQTPLFFKSGRGIRLTPEGRVLKQRASKILQLEEDVRHEFAGSQVGSLNVYVSSEEILQTSFGLDLSRTVLALAPQARIQFLIRTEAQAIQQVLDGETQLAIITHDPPADVESKILRKVEFKVCASKKHPLLARGSRAVPIDELLTHPFVAPDTAILGRIAKSSSIDGWRDDKFPRQFRFKVCGLKLMENLIQDGLALGYLPDSFIESAGLLPVKVTGCSYTCQQTVRLICKDPSALGWLDRLWDQL